MLLIRKDVILLAEVFKCSILLKLAKMASNLSLCKFLSDTLHHHVINMPMVQHLQAGEPQGLKYIGNLQYVQYYNPDKDIQGLVSQLATAELNFEGNRQDFGLHLHFQAMNELMLCLEDIDAKLGPTSEYAFHTYHNEGQWRVWKRTIAIWQDTWQLMKDINSKVLGSIPHDFMLGIVVCALKIPEVFWFVFWEYVTSLEHQKDFEHIKLISDLCTDVIPAIVKRLRGQKSKLFLMHGQSAFDTCLEKMTPAQLKQTLNFRAVVVVEHHTQFRVPDKFVPSSWIQPEVKPVVEEGYSTRSRSSSVRRTAALLS